MNVLIVGATSAIAAATARHYAEQYRASFYLVARNQSALDKLAQDLQVRSGKDVHTGVYDLLDEASYDKWVNEAFEKLGKIDLVLVAHGILGDQQECQQDIEAMKNVFVVNALSKMAVLTLVANKMEQQGDGAIAVISSVAGDRGRPSNYVYGSSKAAVSSFLQGLRARLSKSGVHVTTIKPGFVDTPMTADIEKSGPLWAQPEDIAKGIANAVDKRKNVVYLPWFWRIIMSIIVSIPEFIFKKLSL